MGGGDGNPYCEGNRALRQHPLHLGEFGNFFRGLASNLNTNGYV